MPSRARLTVIGTTAHGVSAGANLTRLMRGGRAALSDKVAPFVCVSQVESRLSALETILAVNWGDGRVPLLVLITHPLDVA